MLKECSLNTFNLFFTRSQNGSPGCGNSLVENIVGTSQKMCSHNTKTVQSCRSLYNVSFRVQKIIHLVLQERSQNTFCLFFKGSQNVLLDCGSLCAHKRYVPKTNKKNCPVVQTLIKCFYQTEQNIPLMLHEC